MPRHDHDTCAVSDNWPPLSTALPALQVDQTAKQVFCLRCGDQNFSSEMMDGRDLATYRYGS